MKSVRPGSCGPPLALTPLRFARNDIGNHRHFRARRFRDRGGAALRQRHPSRNPPQAQRSRLRVLRPRRPPHRRQGRDQPLPRPRDPPGLDRRLDLPAQGRTPPGHRARRARAQAVPLPPQFPRVSRRHEAIDGAQLRFEFRGKSGVEHAVSVTDRHIARIVQRCHDLPGEILFKYLDDDGKRQDVEAEHVNDYLRDATGADVTTKDFRTWAGTMNCAEYLREFGPAKTKKEAERNVVRAIDHASKRLGNTRTVCRKYYIHPALIEAYLKGQILPPMPRRTSRVRRKPGGKLRKHEKQVLTFLRERGKGKGKPSNSNKRKR